MPHLQFEGHAMGIIIRVKKKIEGSGQEEEGPGNLATCRMVTRTMDVSSGKRNLGFPQIWAWHVKWSHLTLVILEVRTKPVARFNPMWARASNNTIWHIWNALFCKELEGSCKRRSRSCMTTFPEGFWKGPSLGVGVEREVVDERETQWT